MGHAGYGGERPLTGYILTKSVPKAAAAIRTVWRDSVSDDLNSHACTIRTFAFKLINSRSLQEGRSRFLN